LISKHSSSVSNDNEPDRQQPKRKREQPIFSFLDEPAAKKTRKAEAADSDTGMPADDKVSNNAMDIVTDPPPPPPSASFPSAPVPVKPTTQSPESVSSDPLVDSLAGLFSGMPLYCPFDFEPTPMDWQPDYDPVTPMDWVLDPDKDGDERMPCASIYA
jgi:hypothetical protein